MPSKPSFFPTAKDLIEHSIARERAIKAIKNYMTFDGQCSDLIISRKTISAIALDLYTLNQLYEEDLVRLGVETINELFFFHWQQDLIAAGVDLASVHRGELNGVDQQTLGIVKRLFPNISHWTGTAPNVQDEIIAEKKNKDKQASVDFEVRQKQWLDNEAKNFRLKKSNRRYKKLIIVVTVIFIVLIGLLFFLPNLLNGNLISQNQQSTTIQTSNLEGAGASITVTDIYPQGSLENMILQKINQERTSRGLGALTENIKLDTAARRHSEDMAIRNFFDHTNPDGIGPNERASAAGYPLRRPAPGGGYFYGVGENIIKYPVISSVGIIWFIPYAIPRVAWYDNNAMADALVQSWMDSPGHRANILDPDYVEIGIGCTWKTETVYSTIDFG